MSFQHIYLPIDFSAASINALQFAAEIAKKTTGEIHLRHVYQKPYYDVAYNGSVLVKVDTEHDTQLRGEINKQMHAVAELDFVKGVKLFSQLVADKPVWKFAEDLESGKADLIVMSTRGHTGILHGGLVGTNAERVIRHAKVPVLSVPDGATFHGIKKIMLATDFKDNLDPILSRVREFQKMFDCELHVVMINTRDNFNTSIYAKENFEKLEKAGIPKLTCHIYNHDSVLEGIDNFAKFNEIDMIAMLNHGRTGFSHLIHGSIAENVSKYLKVPLLTTHIS